MKTLQTVTLHAASSLTSSCEPLTLKDIEAADDSVVQHVNSLRVKVQHWADCVVLTPKHLLLELIMISTYFNQDL